MIVTIDPGVHASGYAFWDEDTGRLINLHYGHHSLYTMGPPPLVLVEKPMVYRGSAVNPNCLIDLAVAVGGIVQRSADVGALAVTLFPFEWKGRMKKDEMLEHIVSKLTPEEIACLKSLNLPKSKEKEVIDALGIGLWFFNRL